MQSKYVMAGDIKTHYIEAGQGDNYVILLHGGEHGANSLLTWEYNIEALSEHFHVFAVDRICYGNTDKLFSFTDNHALRVRQIRNFMEALCIPEAHFIGNSAGSGLILKVASSQNPEWNMKKLITISGGGPNNGELHKFLGDFDGSKEYMRKIHDVLFYDEKWKTEEYIEKRYQESIRPGAWEAMSAARLRAPLPQEEKHGSAPELSQAFRDIKQPVLLCGGKNDELKPLEYIQQVAELIPSSKVKAFEHCSHNAQIECADEFNRVAIQFLLRD